MGVSAIVHHRYTNPYRRCVFQKKASWDRRKGGSGYEQTDVTLSENGVGVAYK